MDRFERISLEETKTDVNADVVLGLCPGCELWQVDYTNEVRNSFVWWSHKRDFASGTAVSTPVFDEWEGAIEAILLEHLMECPHLQLLLVS